VLVNYVPCLLAVAQASSLFWSLSCACGYLIATGTFMYQGEFPNLNFQSVRTWLAMTGDRRSRCGGRKWKETQGNIDSPVLGIRSTSAKNTLASTGELVGASYLGNVL
jgi:hypothetical protein